ncbi:DUF1330 domain-containing protein [Streptomyces adustus]|uniref:DUF1330 domain-containing protein n=1 Tax=Streptomyces adustus TaxID=1609272 RepID=UPI0037142D99
MIGSLENVDICPGIAEYLERIEVTMALYGGRFLVHGGRLVVHEGTWNGAGTLTEKAEVEHVTKVTGTDKRNDILDWAEVWTDSTGGFLSDNAADVTAKDTVSVDADDTFTCAPTPILVQLEHERRRMDCGEESAAVSGRPAAPAERKATATGRRSKRCATSSTTAENSIE